MAGRRHHTIPRFMLRGFASRKRGDEVDVWMYRKSLGQGIELNIKNVGVEKDFYGKANESDLDDRITALETNFAHLVDTLRSQETSDGSIFDDRIPQLVAHLSLRTRQLVQSVLEAFDAMLGQLGEHLGKQNVIEAGVRRGLEKDGDLRKMLDEKLSVNGLTNAQIDLLLTQFQPDINQALQEHITDFMPQVREIVDGHISSSRSMMPDVFKAGYIDSISRNLNAEERVVNYSRYKWFVIKTASKILLGDTACIFETTGKRRFKPLDEGSDDVRRIYLPLSTSRVLVGTPHNQQPLIDFALLNKAITRCSHEFFVASSALPQDSALIKGLGKWSGIFNEKEIADLMKNVKQNLF